MLFFFIYYFFPHDYIISLPPFLSCVNIRCNVFCVSLTVRESGFRIFPMGPLKQLLMSCFVQNLDHTSYTLGSSS